MRVYPPHVRNRHTSSAGRLSIPMPGEALFCAKALAAVWAAVRAFAGVQDIVSGEVALIRKPFPTHITCMGLVPSVYADVSGEVALPRK